MNVDARNRRVYTPSICIRKSSVPNAGVQSRESPASSIYQHQFRMQMEAEDLRAEPRNMRRFVPLLRIGGGVHP